MREFRLVLAGEVTEFAIFVKAINEHEAVVEAGKQYAPQHFEVLRDRVVEVMK
jgi:hypothetical protein